MSMMCWVLGLSLAQIVAVQATPSLARDLATVGPDEQHRVLLAERMSRMSPERREAAQARQRQIERMPEKREAEARMAALRTRLEPMGPFEPALDLEKSWHLLHYLFTGRVDAAAGPAGALMGGEDVGDDLVGYGPARLHDAAQTQDFARFLATLDPARLQARVDYQGMLRNHVYAMPMGRGSEPEFESELRAEVGRYFPRLRDYVAKMAEKQNGLLIWLT